MLNKKNKQVIKETQIYMNLVMRDKYYLQMDNGVSVRTLSRVLS